jgi:hypothetical protein
VPPRSPAPLAAAPLARGGRGARAGDARDAGVLRRRLCRFRNLLRHHAQGALGGALAGSAPISGLRLSPNAALSATELERVHDPAYVKACAPASRAHWPNRRASPGTRSCGRWCAPPTAAWFRRRARRCVPGAPGRWPADCTTLGAAIGAGFCTFNGLALAALAALDLGAKRVLVLDLDAHCGGGTHELLGRHRACASSTSPWTPSTATSLRRATASS